MGGSAVAVIGLGLMGSRMSARLRGAGHSLHGYDPDPDRSAEFVRAGGVVAASPAEAVEGCWAALLSLPNSDISREVCLGPGGIRYSGTEMTVYDATTGWPDDAIDIARELAKAGITYVDSTVSGNGEIAERGELVVMMGGPREAYEQGLPIFEAIGRSHHHVGPVGAGSRMKLIVNHVLAIHRMALAESLVVAELAGMDLGTTLTILKDGLAYSKAMDAWGDRMVAADHDPPFSRLRQSHKDSRLIVDHGLELGATMDLALVVQAALSEGEGEGLGDLDNSAVVEVVRRRARIGRLP